MEDNNILRISRIIRNVCGSDLLSAESLARSLLSNKKFMDTSYNGKISILEVYRDKKTFPKFKLDSSNLPVFLPEIFSSPNTIIRLL